MSYAIEDLIYNLVGEKSKYNSNGTPTSVSLPIPIITILSPDKVNAHIQSDVDDMGLGDCMEKTEAKDI